MSSRRKTASGIKATALSCMAVLLMVMFTIASSSLSVRAYEKVLSFSDKWNVEFTITFKDKEPTVSIKSPDKTYSKDKDYDKVERKDKELHLFIRDAKPGEWKVNASADVNVKTSKWEIETSAENSEPEASQTENSKNENSKTENSKTENSKTENSKTENSKTENSKTENSKVETKPAHESLSVASFTFEQPKNDRVKLKADVKNKTEISYKWTVSAYSANSITGTELSVPMIDSIRSTREPSEAEVDISNLPDGEWGFIMTAEAEFDDGYISKAEALTEKTFKVSGKTNAGDPANIRTSADLTNHIMAVDWSKVEDNYDSMLVSVIDKNGKLLVYDTLRRYDATSTDFIANDDVTVRLLPMRNSSFVTVYKFDLSYAPSVSVTIDTPEVTGDLMVQISYKADNTTVPATVTLNGKISNYNLSGTGTMSLPLEPMSSNSVSVTYFVNDKEQYTVTKTISVQSEPATIEFYGMTDKLVTSADKITIVGKTQPGVKLRMGDTDVAVDENGEFTAEAALQNGENDVSFDIENPYGIHASRTIRVIRTSQGGSAADAVNNSEIPVWLQLVFGLLVTLLCLAAIIVSIMLIRRKKPGTFGKVLIIAKMFLLLCIVLFIGAGVYCLIESFVVSGSISGGSLIDRLEVNDYDGLDTVLQIRNAWLSRMILFFVLGGICIILFVLSIVFNKKLLKLSQRPKKVKAPKPPKPPKAPKAPKAPRQSWVLADPSMVPQDGQPVPQYPQDGQPVPQYPQDGQPVPQYPQSGQPVPQYPQNGQMPVQALGVQNPQNPPQG